MAIEGLCQDAGVKLEVRLGGGKPDAAMTQQIADSNTATAAQAQLTYSGSGGGSAQGFFYEVQSGTLDVTIATRTQEVHFSNLSIGDAGVLLSGLIRCQH